MKKILIGILTFISLNTFAQNTLHAGETDWRDDYTPENSFQAKSTTAGCGTPFLSTGYPAWTNYWAGWMVNIVNVNACPIVINSFEARFQGTTGYRIYTKVGTFVGFELLAGSWTLVGNLAALTGTSVVAPTAIPIAVGITIPAGATQGFYLTRSDNVIANRHLYVPGAGIAGTTIYATDGNLSITEGSYVNPYFAALQVGVRRPSFDVCYTINCPLPIELVSFEGRSYSHFNQLTWVTVTETNNDYFIIERSEDAYDWVSVGKVYGNGTSHTSILYTFKDNNYSNTLNYYRLKQVDRSGEYTYSDIITVDNSNNPHPIPISRLNMLGQPVVDETYKGIVIEYYSDGSVIKRIQE